MAELNGASLDEGHRILYLLYNKTLCVFYYTKTSLVAEFTPFALL